MTKKDNLQKIYDKQRKEWYTVPDDFFKSYDQMCNTMRKRQQYQGHCWCPRKKWWLCDTNCLDCEFHTSAIKSLDEPIINDDSSCTATLLDVTEDKNTVVEKIVADRNLLQYLFAKLRELDPEAEKMITIWQEHPEGISDRKMAKLLGRPQRTFAYELKRFRDKYRHLLDD